ncbi:MAG: class I SAM-dependent methyltransferase [Methanomicrobiales archaeon]|nr:class I SAM-dependent methyltransferase [Methanomicrobiales archaeon]
MPQDVFTRYAADYDRWFDEHPEEYRQELARVQRIAGKAMAPALEIGAGSGRFGAPLGYGFGLEPSPALARLAKGRGIRMVLGVAEHLPFRDGSFRTALMVTVLCFLSDPSRAFREVRRILVTGGTFTVAFIERDGEIARRYLREKVKGRFLAHARFYPVGEVQDLLLGAGFREIMTECSRGFCIITAR